MGMGTNEIAISSTPRPDLSFSAGASRHFVDAGFGSVRDTLDVELERARRYFVAC